MSAMAKLLCLTFLLVAVLVAREITATPSDGCGWAGTAPFCAGRCGVGWFKWDTADTQSHADKLGTNGYGEHYGNNFGSNCVTGSKAYCCPCLDIGDKWDCRQAGIYLKSKTSYTRGPMAI